MIAKRRKKRVPFKEQLAEAFEMGRQRGYETAMRDNAGAAQNAVSPLSDPNLRRLEHIEHALRSFGQLGEAMARALTAMVGTR